MSKKVASSAETPQASRVWDEQAVALLMEQFRIMVQREVRNMKLDVTESIGGMLARRSGIDKELHELAARVDLLAKAVAGFGARLAKIEKGEAPAHARGGPRGRSRDLSGPAPETPREAPPPAPPKAEERRKRGRPKGSGFYSRKRLAMEKGAQS